jgi:hypothetical protein
MRYISAAEVAIDPARMMEPRTTLRAVRQREMEVAVGDSWVVRMRSLLYLYVTVGHQCSIGCLGMPPCAFTDVRSDPLWRGVEGR